MKKPMKKPMSLHRISDRLRAWRLSLLEIVGHSLKPETLLGYAIMALWALLAGQAGGWVLIIVLLAIGFGVHAIAIESGNNVMLWLCAVVLVLYALLAWGSFSQDPSPLMLTFAGCTVLLHNQTIRLGDSRRRAAAVDDSTFLAAGLAVAVVTGISIIGTMLAMALFDRSASWSWLWMPAAAFALFAVGVAVAVVPPWRSPRSDRQRWQPGERLPPQPLGSDEDVTSLGP